MARAHISSHGVKCPDDLTNEQSIFRALSDHRAVCDAKCGRPQRGRGVDQMRTPADRGEGGRKRGHFLVDVLYGRPLTFSGQPYKPVKSIEKYQ